MVCNLQFHVFYILEILPSALLASLIMRKGFSFLCLLLLVTQVTLADKVISDLNFLKGDWAIVGVPVHNYQMLPIQNELKTFLSKDRALMLEIQAKWDLPVTFEDKCDYHYALKFYKDGLLMKTLKLNLYCGYLASDGLAYEFNPAEFERFRTRSAPVGWSRISFADLGRLKDAVSKLDRADEVYWYEDVEPYRYSGFFMVSANRLPWNADLDSLEQAVHKMIRKRGGSNQFYLKKYYHLIQGDHLFARYLVNCEESLANKIDQGNQYLGWRSHLHNTDSVRIVAIGINQRRYWELMNR